MKIFILFIILFSGNIFAEDFLVKITSSRIEINNNNVTANCMSEYKSDYEIRDNILIITQTDTIVDKSYCECKFDLIYNFTPSGLIKKVQIFRNEMIKYAYPENRKYLVYEKDVQFENYNKFPIFSEFNFNQSDCKTSETNLKNQNDFSSFKIIPDYQASVIEIEFNLISPSVVNLKLFNMLGKEVKDIQTSSLKTGMNNIVFYSNELPDGIYIGKLYTDKGKVHTFKLLWKN